MEEQVLVEVKDNFFSKITKAFKKIFAKNNKENLLLAENNRIDIEVIGNDNGFTQQEIISARRAFRKYVINNNSNVSTDIFDYIISKIKENKEKIEQIIEINNDNISYEQIINLIENEKDSKNKFKTKNIHTGRYNVPIGVIGIECSGAEDSIKSMLKSISTRNSIIILQDNFSKYSTESLILLIIKECLKNFYVDDNIIQMFQKEEIDLKKLDKLIKKDGNVIQKGDYKTIYLYQENEEFKDDIQNEVERLQSSEMYKSYVVKPITGEFGNVVNFMNVNKACAVCMYTNNNQKAYKFINWIDSPNVFVNTGIKSCKNIGYENEFFNSKLVLHEGVF